jgi:ribosomal-protein-alanine N-acetyltransferase
LNKAKFPERFPILKTARLILREISHDDTQAIFANFSDPDVARWFFERPLTEVEQATRFIDAFISEFNQGQGLTWAIELKRSGRCVGTCGFGSVKVGDRGEIGFDLARTEWGKGLMSEALAAVLEYGFEDFALTQVEAHTLSSNTRAITLLERLDFLLDRVSEGDHYFSISRR